MPSAHFIEITRSDVGGVRAQATAAREALKGVAKNHLNVTLGNHFKRVPETAPGGAYGYVARTPRYEQEKARKNPNAAPLVKSEALRNFVKTNAVHTQLVTGTQHVATLKLRSPHFLADQQWKELTAIAPHEHEANQRLAMEIYNGSLKAAGARRSKNTIQS